MSMEKELLDKLNAELEKAAAVHEQEAAMQAEALEEDVEVMAEQQPTIEPEPVNTEDFEQAETDVFNADREGYYDALNEAQWEEVLQAEEAAEKKQLLKAKRAAFQKKHQAAEQTRIEKERTERNYRENESRRIREQVNSDLERERQAQAVRQQEQRNALAREGAQREHASDGMQSKNSHYDLNDGANSSSTPVKEPEYSSTPSESSYTSGSATPYSVSEGGRASGRVQEQTHTEQISRAESYAPTQAYKEPSYEAPSYEVPKVGTTPEQGYQSGASTPYTAPEYRKPEYRAPDAGTTPYQNGAGTSYVPPITPATERSGESASYQPTAPTSEYKPSESYTPKGVTPSTQNNYVQPTQGQGTTQQYAAPAVGRPTESKLPAEAFAPIQREPSGANSAYAAPEYRTPEYRAPDAGVTPHQSGAGTAYVAPVTPATERASYQPTAPTSEYKPSENYTPKGVTPSAQNNYVQPTQGQGTTQQHATPEVGRPTESKLPAEAFAPIQREPSGAGTSYAAPEYRAPDAGTSSYQNGAGAAYVAPMTPATERSGGSASYQPTAPTSGYKPSESYAPKGVTPSAQNNYVQPTQGQGTTQQYVAPTVGRATESKLPAEAFAPIQREPNSMGAPYVTPGAGATQGVSYQNGVGNPTVPTAPTSEKGATQQHVAQNIGRTTESKLPAEAFAPIQRGQSGMEMPYAAATVSSIGSAASNDAATIGVKETAQQHAAQNIGRATESKLPAEVFAPIQNGQSGMGMASFENEGMANDAFSDVSITKLNKESISEPITNGATQMRYTTNKNGETKVIREEMTEITQVMTSADSIKGTAKITDKSKIKGAASISWAICEEILKDGDDAHLIDDVKGAGNYGASALTFMATRSEKYAVIGTGHTLAELKGMDAVAMEGLQLKKTTLMAKLNQELQVSGNVAMLLTDEGAVDKFLERVDLSDEARNTALELKSTMEEVAAGTQWLTVNSKELNEILPEDALSAFGVNDVRNLDIKQLKSLTGQLQAFAGKNIADIEPELTDELMGLLDGKSLGSVPLDQITAMLDDETMSDGLKGVLGDYAKKHKSVALLQSRRNVLKAGINKNVILKGKRRLFGQLKRDILNGIFRSGDDNLAMLGNVTQMYSGIKSTAMLGKTIWNASYAGNFINAQTLKAANVVKAAAKNTVAGTKIDIVAQSVNKIKTQVVQVPAKFVGGVQTRFINFSEGIKKKLITRASNTRIGRVSTKAVGAIKQVGKKVTTKISNSTVGKLASKAQKALQAMLKGIRDLFAACAKIAAVVGGILGSLLIVFVIMVIISMLMLTVFAADDVENDIQSLVDDINTYRDEMVIDTIYEAFKDDTDPNGNPYGYTTLDGATSNNITSGVTWEFADGVSNNTAEILSLAAVYFQQNWPSSYDILNFFDSDAQDFFEFCKKIAEYGMDVTAQESEPYSCITNGGCVVGYQSAGEIVTVTNYSYSVSYTPNYKWYAGGGWYSNYDAIPVELQMEASYMDAGGSYSESWSSAGTSTATVYFSTIFPDSANSSVLERDASTGSYNTLTDGGISYGTITNGTALIVDANTYKGVEDDWFYSADGTLQTTFTVWELETVTVNGRLFASIKTQTITVSFTNGTAYSWCPGELNDGLHGHYDLNVTVYLTGYEDYQSPTADASTEETGTLYPLSEEINDGELTRTVVKLNQYGEAYSGGTSSRYTKTVLLPEGDEDFTYWYDDAGEDSDDNVDWASIFYLQDWGELYNVTTGIKCQSAGETFSSAEVEAILATFDNGSISAARQAVISAAISAQGRFSYQMGSKASGGAGNVSVGSTLDCSGFIQYCYWIAGYSFSAVNTADYTSASDLTQISESALQPGDLQVMLASSSSTGVGHVRMYLGTIDGVKQWAECCGSYGTCVNSWTTEGANMSNCIYFTYTGF